jgi:hypothetical protein
MADLPQRVTQRGNAQVSLKRSADSFPDGSLQSQLYLDII